MCFYTVKPNSLDTRPSGSIYSKNDKGIYQARLNHSLNCPFGIRTSLIFNHNIHMSKSEPEFKL